MMVHCDNCDRTEKEQYLYKVYDLKICRKCQVFMPIRNLIFKCDCRAWDTDLLKAKCSNNGLELKCYKCNSSILASIINGNWSLGQEYSYVPRFAREIDFEPRDDND